MEFIEDECVVLDDVNATGPCNTLSDAQYWPLVVKRKRIKGLEILFTILFFIILLIGLLGNSITLTVFSNIQRKMVLKNNNLFVLLNMCICDNLTIFLVVPFSVVLLVSDRIYYTNVITKKMDAVSSVFCNIVGAVFNCTSRSILFLLAIAATDRAIALFIPFKYKQIVTIKRVKALVLMSHVTSVLVSLIPFFSGSGYYLDANYATCHYNFESVVDIHCIDGDITVSCNSLTPADGKYVVSNRGAAGSTYFFLVVLVVILPAVVMVASSIAVVHKLLVRVRDKRNADDGNKSGTGKLLNEKNKKKKDDPQQAAAITISYLVVLYMICYIPWWILSLETWLEYLGVLPYRYLSSMLTYKFSHYFMLYLTFVTYLNSALNPMIYFGRNKQLMDMFDSIVKFRANLIQPPLKKTISGPVSSVEIFG